MSFNYPRSGLNNVAEYQASGLPWVTSSAVGNTPVQINFPHVTNWIHIRMLGGGNLRYGWTALGVNNSNYGTLAVSSSFEAPLRMKSLFVRSDGVPSSSFEIVAGLTMILHHDFPTLTGSSVYPNSSSYGLYGYGIQGSVASGSGVG